MTITFVVPLAASLLLLGAALPAHAAEEFKDEYPYRGGQCKYEFKADDQVEEKWECKYPQPDTRKVEHKRDYAYRGGTCKHEYKSDQGKVEEKSDCKYPLRGSSARAAPRELPPWVGSAPADDAPVIAGGRCNREQIGRVIGGAAGAAIGSQIGDGTERSIAIVGGAVIGAIVGGRIGRSMDEADQACVGQALEQGKVGREVAWDAPTEPACRFSVTPTRDYRNAKGERCREYVAATDEGKAPGAACRQPDGAWRAVQ